MRSDPRTRKATDAEAKADVTRPRRLFLLALAVGALWGVNSSVQLLDQIAGTPAPLPEVDRRFVELRRDRVHRLGRAEPFTGWLVEHYANGVLRSRSAVRHGRLHGVSEGWHPDGQLQVREHFVLGVSEGWRVKWHPNGRKLSQVHIRQGKLEGVFRHWHENGVLAEEINLQAGEPQGLSRSWYPSGFLKAQAVVAGGSVQDQQFWTDGEKPGGPRVAAVSR